MCALWCSTLPGALYPTTYPYCVRVCVRPPTWSQEEHRFGSVMQSVAPYPKIVYEPLPEDPATFPGVPPPPPPQKKNLFTPE